MKSKLIALFAIIILLASTANAQWSELGGDGNSKFDSAIFTIATNASGNIYAAGKFSNGNRKMYVGKFNGNSWDMLGDTVNSLFNSYINIITTDMNGNVYAAGKFTNGSGKNYVAKWNGSSWSELGGLNKSAFNNGISSICIDSKGNIYASSGDKNLNGMYYVSKWDGNTWSELGGANSSTFNNSIRSITNDSYGNLYAIGAFKNVSLKCYVAKWNGSTWSQLGSIDTTFKGTLSCITTDLKNNVYVSGNFSNANNKKYVVKWNGSNWSELGGINNSTFNSTISSLATDVSGNLYAAGLFTNGISKMYVAKWNGSNWGELGGTNKSTFNGGISSITTDAKGNILAAGSFKNFSGNQYIAEFIDNSPIISSYSPNTGGGGDTITIRGLRLTGTTSVTLGGSPALSFIVTNDSTIKAIVGTGSSGYVLVNKSGQTDSLSGFVFIPPPNLIAFNPLSGSQNTFITINGHRLTGSKSVFFGGTSAASFNVLNDSTINAVVGTGSSGYVSVTTTKGTISLSGFVFIPPPTITSFSPQSGGAGTPVRIYGSNFTGVTSVSFGGIPATSLLFYNDGMIKAYVGEGASGNVTVTTNAGKGSLSGFVYDSITSFTPGYGGWGDTITIHGGGFTNAKSVKFGGTSANFHVINDSTISAILTIGAASGSVYVYNSNGTIDSLAGFKFITPHINSFSPKIGTYGTPITINGSGFKYLSNQNYNSLNGIVFFGANNGNNHEDSIVILSDSVLIAWVGIGQSGYIYSCGDSLPGFTYQSLPAITNSGWDYLGKAGFSSTNPYRFVNTACGTDNIPYIVYVDSTSFQIRVMKFEGNNWLNVGKFDSIGLCKKPLDYYTDSTQYLQLLLDNSNNPIVAFSDSTNNGTFTIKKLQGGNWITLTNPSGITLGSITIDKYNNLYNFDGMSVYTFNNGIWSAVGSINFTNPYYDLNYFFYSIAIDKSNNTPYIVYPQSDSTTGQPQATVMKFNGTKWVTVGQPIFTSPDASIGAYYVNLTIDGTGVPWVSAQTDNSFERASVYKYTNGAWQIVGYPRFTKGHVHFLSFTLNKMNQPYLLYRDGTYNFNGTAMTYTDTGSWKPLGVRGSIPGYSFLRNSMAIDGNNTPIIAFKNYSQSGRVSVMKYGTDPLPISNLNITAYTNLNYIELTWQTATELNTSNFIIQHSIDGNTFQSIGSVNAIGSGSNSYQFTDKNPVNGINYYRLQSVDKDGSTSYSKVISAEYSVSNSQFTIYPNPAKNTITIQLNHINTIELIDNIGKVMNTVSLKDATNPTININDLKVGVYHLRVKTTDGKTKSSVFIKE